MRRILMVLTVALVMAAMVVATAVPALAFNTGSGRPGSPLYSGNPDNANSAVVVHCTGTGFQDAQGVKANNKNNTGGQGTC